MRRTEIGTTGVEASRIALGVMRIAGKTDREACGAVGAALDEGVDFLDTADVYADGAASEKLGRTLRSLDVDRDRILIQTKVGMVQGNAADDVLRYDFSKNHLLHAVDAELTRLRTDHIDFLLLHRPDVLCDVDEIAEAFDVMERSGKVRYFGVSDMNDRQIEFLQRGLERKLHVAQLQFGLKHSEMVQAELNVNMAGRPGAGAEGGILPFVRLSRMSLQAWSPFQYGWFEGPFVDNPKFPELNAVLERVADRHGTNKNAIAAAWILRMPLRGQVIAGSMNPLRIRQIAQGGDIELDRQEWWDLYQAAAVPLV